MHTDINEVVLLREDYKLLQSYLKITKNNIEQNYLRLLLNEIKRATVVSREDIPPDVIRLNSTAIIKDVATEQVMAVTLVLLEQADLRNGKVSVLDPIGTMLIGFKKGMRFGCPLPKRYFTLEIVDVYNEHPFS
ncbi:MAG TPA: GreA/GreB family elongation factor [Puia sp.]|nr:GreA/GreB family elongation factor [Puia sp.]